MWKRVVGNDDERELWLHIDELNPTSHLRSILVNDCIATPLRVNISRDLLRSVVASQRCGRHIAVGEAKIEELVLELERDCVDIYPHDVVAQTSYEQRVYDMCEQFASAMAEWPMMRRSMHASLVGGSCYWDVGPLHCYVQLLSKPENYSSEFESRPLREMLQTFAYLMERTNTRIDNAREVDDLFRQLENGKHGPFWWLALDGGKSAKKSSLCGIITGDSPNAQRCQRWLQIQHRRIPNIAHLVSDSPRIRRMVEYTFKKRGMHLVDAGIEHRYLMMPTMWVFNEPYRHATTHRFRIDVQHS